MGSPWARPRQAEAEEREAFGDPPEVAVRSADVGRGVEERSTPRVDTEALLGLREGQSIVRSSEDVGIAVEVHQADAPLRCVAQDVEHAAVVRGLESWGMHDPAR